ncbi:MAG TPA: hypothetical protein PKD32_12070 [Saprospiraceae bacterium]|nr:hypothetical protein [Saprospiraceae bacterium]
MKAKFPILVGLLLLLFCSCTIPTMLVSKDLKENAEVMKVKGLRAFFTEQSLEFGEYHSSPLKMQRITGKGSYDRVWVSKTKLKQDFNFLIYDSTGRSVKVDARNRFVKKEMTVFRDLNLSPMEYKVSFEGTISLQGDTSNNWKFIIIDAELDRFNSLDCGIIENNFGEKIKIKKVYKFESQTSIFQSNFSGYEFFYDNRSVGAVCTVNKRCVWIKRDLDSNLKLMLAGISTALINRVDLRNHNN